VGSYRSAGFDDWAQLTGALSSAWLREQGVAMAQSAAISATGGLATGILSGGLAAEVGEATYIASVTAKGSRYANTVAGLGARQFERNLLANGFRVAQRTIGKNGPVTILKNAQRTYVIYKATSTGEASAQVFTAAGQSLGKIRLIGF
jgi:hypothetical protein